MYMFNCGRLEGESAHSALGRAMAAFHSSPGLWCKEDREKVSFLISSWLKTA
jgi:hypothetical protein